MASRHCASVRSSRLNGPGAAWGSGEVSLRGDFRVEVLVEVVDEVAEGVAVAPIRAVLYDVAAPVSVTPNPSDDCAAVGLGEGEVPAPPLVSMSASAANAFTVGTALPTRV